MTAAASVARELPGRALRGSLLWASRRRSLARVATATPLTRGMVWRFVAGETLEAGLGALARLREAGFHTTADVLGEAVSSEAMAARAADAYIRLLEGLDERGLEGNVSVKLTQLGLDHRHPGLSRDSCAGWSRRPRAPTAFVRVDMEDSPSDRRHAGPRPEMHETHPDVGAVIQAYLRRIGGRRRRARRRGHPCAPVQGRLPGAGERGVPAQGGRGRQLRAADADAAARGHLPGHRDPRRGHDRRGRWPSRGSRASSRDRFEFQMLYGIRRDLQDRLRGRGLHGARVRPVRDASGTPTSCAGWPSARPTSFSSPARCCARAAPSASGGRPAARQAGRRAPRGG